jgi:alpha-beta hydrolase superfamily lysophospholipase
MAHLGKHAVVIGASMGGLLAARALVDYYDEVKGSRAAA